MPASKRPAPEFVVNDLETLKVLADPLRIQILELITHTPRTVKQIAAALNIAQTKLYYHIKQLEERGLIVVVDTRIVSGILEKHYQSAAYSYHVNKALFSPTLPSGMEGLEVMLTGLFEDTKEDIQKSVAEGVIDVLAPENDEEALPRSLLISRKTLHISLEQAEEFYRRLRALIREYQQENGHTPDQDDQAYGLLVTLYPTRRSTVLPPEDV